MTTPIRPMPTTTRRVAVLRASAIATLGAALFAGAAGAIVQHREGGTPAVAAFAHGYVRGLAVKAATCFLFAELLVRMAALPALLLALAGGVICGALLMIGLRRAGAPREAGAPHPPAAGRRAALVARGSV